MSGSAEFDVFISANSRDYGYAGQLFEMLVARGLRVFFSERSLSDLGQSDYRRAIDDALDRTRHMVVVTSSGENVRSRWVEAEWGLFINEHRSGYKSGNLVTLLCGEFSLRDLPASLRQYQAFPMVQVERIFPYLGLSPDPVADQSRQSEDRPPASSPTEKSAISVQQGSVSKGPADVVASFAPGDSGPADRLIKAIANAGLRVRAIPNAIQPSDTLEDRAYSLTRDCFIFIPILSHHTLETGEVLRARVWKYAASLSERGSKRLVLPVILEPVSREVEKLLPKAWRDLPQTRCEDGIPPPSFIAMIARQLQST